MEQLFYTATRRRTTTTVRQVHDHHGGMADARLPRRRGKCTTTRQRAGARPQRARKSTTTAEAQVDYYGGAQVHDLGESAGIRRRTGAQMERDGHADTRSRRGADTRPRRTHRRMTTARAQVYDQKGGASERRSDCHALLPAYIGCGSTACSVETA
jgi:hypothetical protein